MELKQWVISPARALNKTTVTLIILDQRLISQEFNEHSTRRSKLNETDDKPVIMRRDTHRDPGNEFPRFHYNSKVRYNKSVIRRLQERDPGTHIR